MDRAEKKQVKRGQNDQPARIHTNAEEKKQTGKRFASAVQNLHLRIRSDGVPRSIET